MFSPLRAEGYARCDRHKVRMLHSRGSRVDSGSADRGGRGVYRLGWNEEERGGCANAL